MNASAALSGSNQGSQLHNMAPGRVVSPTAEAAKVAAKLKEIYTDEIDQCDLGNHGVELLREVLSQLSIDEHYPELRRVTAFLQTTLLSLRAHLLEWDARNVQGPWLDFPLAKLPEKPRDCWTLQHPRQDILASEVTACIGFLGAHPTCFDGPVWDWLRATLEVMKDAAVARQNAA